MPHLELYMDVDGEKLRCGYTTGTCAAAAARGALERLLLGRTPGAVRIRTPAGPEVEAELLAWSAGPDWASCAVRKDGGDDPDVTHDALIFARAERGSSPGVVIDGGAGVGRVTKPGLDQPPGEAAINRVPRQMIREQAEAVLAEAGECGGVKLVISVPGGERLAAKTFNLRLGIVGGVSILGTGGIVRPMSEAALIASVRLELDVLRASGAEHVLVTPGNYGEDFAQDILGLSLRHWALCSNYVGEAIDHAAALGFRSFLLVGHFGKLCKTAAGAMNTHSRAADGRAEVICTHAALCGADAALVARLYACPTTDGAVALLTEAGILKPVMARIAAALDGHLKRRAGDMEIEALFFSNQYGVLGKTPGADRLLNLHKAD